ncbi:MAG: undecaprenyldiphospho-muramoylpentapeptide beta-N-acetylglucosaminyltransferase [Arachnia propionica]|nr:MAG: undecaprenyldiphospho-muramoylpentapeptide beta-N-acetylglucosaminyltransferase [Arachnia propionica]
MVSVALAGGGTAGHTSPLIATAKAILELAPQAKLVCIGTPKGLETRVIPAAGLELKLIPPVPMPRRVNLDLIKLPYRLTKAVWQSRRILREAKADVLVGFGGYASIPAYLAARWLGIPVVIHEANLLPGLANRVGAKFAARVATAFPDTSLPKAKHIGMPMAKSISDNPWQPEVARAEFGLAAELPVLLVSGGSQGARAINLAVADVIPRLLAAGVQVLHVLGPKNFTDEHQPQQAENGACYQPVAFVEDMSLAYAAADLMVARAGAATVMETAVSGLPVIFIPLPWGNGEQARNAASLVAVGAGVMLPESELTADRLASEVLGLCESAEDLAKMGQLAREHYPAQAASELARTILGLQQEE